MASINNTVHHRSGFALLMTLIVVSVVITITLSIIDVTIKQTRLTGSASDSEVAFHAANAGIECAQYERRVKAAEMEGGAENITFACFGLVASATINGESIDVSPSPGSAAYHYAYEVTWGTGAQQKCTQIDTVVIVAGTETTTVAGDELLTIMPRYPNSERSCSSGGVCTIIASRGYNRSCPSGNASFSPGTIQREVLLEY